MVFVKLFLLGISTLGSLELIRKICDDKVDIYFLPSLTIAIQVTFLFAAGLLNLLPEVTYVLYFIGFAGFIYGLCKKKTSVLKPYMNAGYVFLLISLILLGLYLSGKILSHIDNFSHWGLVVKEMLEANRFPNFEGSLTKFQEYPLGSAAYIYFFAKLTSSGESIQMFAQTYMMLAAILPLFSFAKKNRLPAAIVIASFTNYALSYNIRITNLLVDTLLPLVGICGLLFTYLHCKSGEKVPLYFSAFYMVQIIQIKNSGIFFAAFTAILLFVFAWKKKAYLHGIICAALPFISLILWQKHCKYVFSQAAASKHAMTAENYKSVFESKTQEDILSICSSLFKYEISYKDVWITVGICALIAVLIILFKKKKLLKLFLKIAVFSLILYVVYQLGLLAMYLFSMPGREATNLACIDRYTKTILIAILYLNMVPAVRLISETAKKMLMSAVAAAGIFLSFFVGIYISTGSVKTVFQKEMDENEKRWTEERKWLEEANVKYEVPTHESYCILIPSSGDPGFTYYYIGEYIFMSTDITAFVVESEESLDGIAAKYIFVYDQDNENINNWIEANYPEQLGNEVIIQSSE